MNLVQVIEGRMVKSGELSRVKTLVRSREEEEDPLAQQYDSIERLQRYALDKLGTLQKGGEIQTIIDRETKAINDLRRVRLIEDGTLCERFMLPPLSRSEGEWNRGHSCDNYGDLARSPKVTTRAIRELCDALGFVVIPYDYLNRQSYAHEVDFVRGHIERFGDIVGFQAFVLCPFQYYSIIRHVQADDASKPIYAGRHSQAFMAASMMVPAIRAMNLKIDALRLRVDEIGMSLEELRKTVERQQRDAALAQAADKELRRRLEEVEARLFSAQDPMMFALPVGMDLFSDGLAFVGPCWGPDFMEIVLTAIGMKKEELEHGMMNQVYKVWKGDRRLYFR